MSEMKTYNEYKCNDQNEEILERAYAAIRDGDYELAENLFGSLVGGLTGFSLGEMVGRTVAEAIGAEKGGPLYDLLTSKLVAGAVGATIGKRIF